jgi:hypothetical protein
LIQWTILWSSTGSILYTFASQLLVPIDLEPINNNSLAQSSVSDAEPHATERILPFSAPARRWRNNIQPYFSRSFPSFSFPLFSSSSIYLHFAYQMLGVANKV